MSDNSELMYFATRRATLVHKVGKTPSFLPPYPDITTKISGTMLSSALPFKEPGIPPTKSLLH